MKLGALRLEDLPLLRESTDRECKLAQGQDGQGELPNDFWHERPSRRMRCAHTAVTSRCSKT